MCDIVAREETVSVSQDKKSALDMEMGGNVEEVPTKRNPSRGPSGGDQQKLVDEVKGDGAQDEPVRARVDREGREKEKGRKRKKPRRGKSKKPQWLRGKDSNVKDEESGKKKRMRPSVFIHSQPAPNNTTQFIMADHTELQDFDVQLTALKGAVSKASRARDSSLSIDSDEEFYSSPEDEEEFLTKEFSNTYEDVHVERLGTMTKEELIQEYLQLEERVDLLEKKLKSGESTGSGSAEQCGNGGAGTDSEGEQDPGEMPMERAMAEKIRIFQEEINKLIVENEQLNKENDRLRSSGSLVRPSSSLSSSSIDSESDSSTSSGTTSSSSSSRSSHSRLSVSSNSQRSHTPTSEHVQENEAETATTIRMDEGEEVLSVIEVRKDHNGTVVNKSPTDDLLETAFVVEGSCAPENPILSSVLAS